jgi:hypothetical protein
MYPDSDDSGPELERSADRFDWALDVDDKEKKKRAAKALRGLEMPCRLCRSTWCRVADGFDLSQ